ncbi:flagellar motor protein MotB [Solirhodobacter olei]|uniref:flagellar motor protein MotB n=1 Tax=Solirhodobacter olei TaxID=2493082 RepID=UPI000FD6DFD2|nr:flagellar motor protein MotB [Solirhodobacter olei]
MQANAAPIIIKRKKVVAGGGHHGGAWKVAYADFVTAMMTFFLLMWLLNATTEKQRKGIADYFSPNIPINRVSGGGDGAFGGDSIFTEKTMAHSGTGASRMHPTASHKARGVTGTTSVTAPGRQDSTAVAGAQPNTAAALKSVEKDLLGTSGESNEMKDPLRHIVTRITDEGLIVEIFDLQDSPLFQPETAQPRPVMRDIAKLLSQAFGIVTNRVAVNGHVKSYPVVLKNNPVWDLSTARAQKVRDLLQGAGLDRMRMERVTGYADRKPAVQNPEAIRNNRIDVILLRDGK